MTLPVLKPGRKALWEGSVASGYSFNILLPRLELMHPILQNGLSDRVPQEHKDRASDELDHAKTFFTDEYFPKERRDQFIYRGKKVIIECQKHDDYQASLKWLLDTLETYSSHGKQTTKNAHSQSKDVVQVGFPRVALSTEFNNIGPQDSALTQATRELRMLLERFANGMSVDHIKDAIDALYDDANRDEGLRNWFKQVNGYARKVLLQPGYVLEPACNTEGREIRENGRTFYDDKYRDHFDNLFRVCTFFGGIWCITDSCLRPLVTGSSRWAKIP